VNRLEPGWLTSHMGACTGVAHGKGIPEQEPGAPSSFRFGRVRRLDLPTKCREILDRKVLHPKLEHQGSLRGSLQRRYVPEKRLTQPFRSPPSDRGGVQFDNRVLFGIVASAQGRRPSLVRHNN